MVRRVPPSFAAAAALALILFPAALAPDRATATPGPAAPPTSPTVVQQAAEGEALVASSASVTVAIRRLTESQYRNVVADVLGEDLEINARFEPEMRDQGLLAIGGGILALSPSGVEQLFGLATGVAAQALAPERRERLMTCRPGTGVASNETTDETIDEATDETIDESCVRPFLAEIGERLFRRPLTGAEIDARVAAAVAGTERSGDVYTGLEVALASFLAAPEFLFRVETAEPDPERPGEMRLDAHSKAARLSFLIWNTAPDRELLAAAAAGSLHTPQGLAEQIERLISSPRFEQGARAFFSDMLQLDGLDNLVKDPSIYPKYSQSIADAAREQMLRTVIALLVEQERDYRDLFTTDETFLNRALAAVYRVPYPSAEEWAPYTFAASSERAGIFSQIAFLAAFAHPGSSSPTRRGIKLYEIFLCDPTPDPPADVDFSRVTDSQEGTVRGRLLDHMENTGCAFCHRRTDPPGLALEHFDGLGQLRQFENGTLIDVSADVFGDQIVGARGLGELLHRDPQAPRCLVRNVFAYGVGRATDYRDEGYLAERLEAFVDAGHRFPELVRQIAGSEGFFAVPPREAPGNPVAAAQPAAPRR